MGQHPEARVRAGGAARAPMARLYGDSLSDPRVDIQETDVGAVIGATIGCTDERLDFNGPVLAPGFGAQGGAASEIAPAWDSQGLGGVVNSSRKIIFAYRDASYAAKFGEADWKGAVSAAIAAWPLARRSARRFWNAA